MYRVALIIILLAGLTTAADKPNIIFFIADDVSQEDFGCYGHTVIKTPHTDKLAANGMRFDNAYLTTSSCSPSRCSIITGRYPHNTGAPELHVKLPDTQVRFPELLRKAGYYTVLSGKNHMFGKTDRAFDKITVGGGPGGSQDWVEHVRNRPKDKPFFFWFAAYDAHRSWQTSQDLQQYEPDDMVVPPYLVDTTVTREDLARYCHEVSRFDHFIGLVTAELKKQEVLDNTLIVVAADNGRPFPRCKARLYDSGIETPWVVHYPKLITKPSTSQSLVSVIDLSATCLELAGVNAPECIQGRSFLPILTDPKATIRDMVFSEHNWHVYQAHERMVRFGDFVYIKNNYPNLPNLSSESDPKYPAGKELWLAHAAGRTTAAQQQVFALPSPVEELFLVTEDFDQLRNLADDPKYKDALTKGRALVAKWTEQTGDTVPKNPSKSRYPAPKIDDGEIIPPPKGKRAPRGELPGAAAKATTITHPGPIRYAE